MVLLPKAILPLHLFEPRYRAMAHDALAGARLVAMAYLKPGYEPRYYTHDAPIHRVLCLGRIIRGEQLADGRYNVLLQGLERVTCDREDRGRPYRRGWLAPIECDERATPEQEAAARESIRRVLADNHSGDAEAPSAAPLIDVLNCATLCLSDQVDLLAFNAFCDPDARQAFLSDPCPIRRAACLVEVIRRMRDGNCTPAGSARRRPDPSCN